MAEAARGLGEKLVEAEAQLDRAFSDGSIDAERLAELTAAAATTRGELRAVHLSAHLDMMEILTEQQVATYVRERGYSGH